jgi:hypothetical protein
MHLRMKQLTPQQTSTPIIRRNPKYHNLRMEKALTQHPVLQQSSWEGHV